MRLTARASRPAFDRSGPSGPGSRDTPGLAALVAAVAAVWLLFAALPVSADGGPHRVDINTGTSTLTADTCASCHRAHTAGGEYLITAASEEALCLTCHGRTGAGATTNVQDGVQYTAANDGTGTGAVAGALRSGGFVTARISSDDVSRISYPAFDSSTGGLKVDFSSRVPVLAAGEPVTSAHMHLAGATSVTLTGIAWGNGPISATANAGPALALACSTCHNPHGNGRYRVLNPLPTDDTGPLVEATANANVTDAALPGAGQTRNYTIKDGVLLSNVTGTATDGDYWRRRVPWDMVPTYDPLNPLADPDGIVPETGPWHQDAPNGLNGFRSQINTWCRTCHTRHFAGGTGPTVPSGDAIYMYRHPTNSQVTCTQCHVAHGSNASMPGTYTGRVAYPGSTTGSPSSRLLKVDNRGTCQQCHDPTKSRPWGVTDHPGP